MSAVKCLRCRNGVPHDVPHGETGYEKHGCRCQVCTQGRRDKARRHRANPENRARDRRCSRESADRRRDKVRAADRATYLRNRAEKLAAAKDYRERNADYVRARDAARRKRFRHAGPAAPRTGKWSQAEKRIVLRDDVSRLELAYMLNRSPVAVEKQRTALRRVA